jgi:hypothetical protein
MFEGRRLFRWRSGRRWRFHRGADVEDLASQAPTIFAVPRIFEVHGASAVLAAEPRKALFDAASRGWRVATGNNVLAAAWRRCCARAGRSCAGWGTMRLAEPGRARSIRFSKTFIGLQPAAAEDCSDRGIAGDFVNHDDNAGRCWRCRRGRSASGELLARGDNVMMGFAQHRASRAHLERTASCHGRPRRNRRKIYIRGAPDVMVMSNGGCRRRTRNSRSSTPCSNR